jgi:hypothetical protein
MTKELVDKLTNLSVLGYYDKDLKMLCAHFFGDEAKHDLIAYLKPDLTWDLREVLSERTELTDIGATVSITHASLGQFEAGSKFDYFIRATLKQSLESIDYGTHKVEIEDTLQNGYANIDTQHILHLS